MTRNLRFLILIILFISLLTLLTQRCGSFSIVGAEASDAPVVIYFFYAHGCSYCKEASQYLQEIQQVYPTLEIRSYDVYLDPEARSFYTQILETLSRTPQGMPTIIIGEKVWVGFQKGYEAEIQSTLDSCLSDGCPDIGSMTESENPVATGLNSTESEIFTITIPIFGEMALDSVPLVVSTLIIGFIDGFNPCSLWILTVLLTLTLTMQSRPKILLMGTTFIAVSSLVYALFISGLFTMMSVFEYHKFIQSGLSLIALVFALINIKDYFFFRKGVSLTISDEKKPRLYQRIRQTVSFEKSLITLLLSTVALAAGVSLLEFSCTSGFPILWINLITNQRVDSAGFVLLMLVYLLIYNMDEMGVFLLVFLTMRSIKLTEQHGRFLKLLSGTIMLVLAVILLIRPEWMNSLNNVLILFASMIGVTFIVDKLNQQLNKVR